MVQLQVQKKISKNRKVTENVILKKKKDNTAKKKRPRYFFDTEEQRQDLHLGEL